jgi:dTDP-L-rhamnose 4-epimerase
MARALAGAIDARLEPQVTGEWRAGDVRHIVASPARAAERLGFEATTGFEAGMAELAGLTPA